MHTLSKPPADVLDRCHQVHVSNLTLHIKKMRIWCWENKLSLVWFELINTSRADYADYATLFYFTDPSDATLFSLKFQ